MPLHERYGSRGSACPNCGSESTERIFRRNPAQKWYLARCTACDQHFTDPQPTLEEIKGFYTTETYHHDLHTVEGTEHAFGRKFRDYVNWIAPRIRPGGRTLDVGCSTGLLPFLLKQRGFAAEGLELNRNSAEFGRRAFGLTIKNEPFETAEFEPASFSLVSMTDVLEHAFNPIATLHRVHDMLEDGGYAYITFPDISSLESRYFYVLAKLSGRRWLWQNCHVPLHTFEFTRPTAESIFLRAGFQLAGFRRRHDLLHEKRPWKIALLYLPSRLILLPPLSQLFGTRMEFLIRKQSCHESSRSLETPEAVHA